MKNFKQLIRELPSNKVVAAFGQFQPPTAGHESLVKAVQTIAGTNEHIIYASTNEDKKQNPLPTDRKIYFLQRMFSEGKFTASTNVNSILEMAIDLSKKYKHLTVVTFSNKVNEVTEQLNQQNGKLYTFQSIKVISAGEIDPDNNTVSAVSGIKMCESAKHGDIVQFKKGVPHTLTELDSRRLMNDVRRGMGLDPIRENIIYERTKVREQYVAGKIFNVGDRVTDEDGIYEIMDRGANYITVVNESGTLMKKWIDKVSPSRKKIEENLETNANEICFKNYTTANFHKNPKVFHAFKGTISTWEQGGIEDGVAVLNAIKHTDSYLSMVDGKDRTSEENKAKQALNRIGQYQSHNYWDDHKVITTDDVMAKHNADLQNAIKSVKEESEVMDSKKIAMRYKDFMKKAGSKEPAVEIAEPAAGKPMSVLKNKEGKLKTQDQNDLPEHIEKVAGGYEVESEHGNKNLGKSKSLSAAKKRLKQVEYFKHMKEDNKHHEEAEEHLSKANDADAKGDTLAFHHHMADHHDSMSQWHDSKGRSASADRHAEKAEYHSDKYTEHARGVKEAVVNFPKTKDDHPREITGHDTEHAWALKHVSKNKDDKISYQHNGVTIHHPDGKHTFILGGHKPIFDKDSKGKLSLKKDLSAASHAYVMPTKSANKNNVVSLKKEEAEETINELSTELLGRYKTAAGASAKASDAVGNYKKGDKRFKGINKATNKQFDNDLKKHDQVKEDVYSSDTRTKKVQVQDKDGNWVFRDHKSHPHKINFGASKMNGKPAGAEDPLKSAKLDTETAYRNHLEKMAKLRADGSKVTDVKEAWVLNPTGKSKKKYKDIKDNKTLNVSNTAPFDAFSNTNNQT
jgi:phosphopantetheine adenylyltransferase